ncbi:hypothetical protein ACQ4PT_045612 [Festuca glaucescens]
MKDAARTSVLSSEWRQGWVSYPKLRLNSETMLGIRRGDIYYASEEKAQKYRGKFIENVHAVMRQHQGFWLEEFVLEYGFHEMDAHHIDSWVTRAASMRLKRLVIDLSELRLDCRFDLKQYALALQLVDEISTVEHLCILELRNLSLKPIGDFGGFLNLTMLELQHVCVAKDDLESMLCKCPALERLALNLWGRFVSLQIGHQLRRLEHFSLGDGTLVEKLQIDAINLKTISHSDNIREIVTRKDSRITETSEVPKCRSSFMHLRQLTLSMHLNSFCKFDILRLVDVLEAAPVLEHFELTVEEFMSPFLYGDESLPLVPIHPHDHLKTALFKGFAFNEDLVALALYILRSAESLELMAVRTRYESGRRMADHFLRREDSRNVVDIAPSVDCVRYFNDVDW